MFNYDELQRLYTSIGMDESIVTAMVSLATVLDKYDLDAEQQRTVFSLLSDAGRDSLKGLPEKVLTGAWRDFDYGNVKIGDYVRVKHDAYDSVSGAKHNGRVGTLKHMSHNRCSVEYVGAEVGNNMSHPMDNLESLRLL